MISYKVNVYETRTCTHMHKQAVHTCTHMHKRCCPALYAVLSSSCGNLGVQDVSLFCFGSTKCLLSRSQLHQHIRSTYFRGKKALLPLCATQTELVNQDILHSDFESTKSLLSGSQLHQHIRSTWHFRGKKALLPLCATQTELGSVQQGTGSSWRV